MSGPKINLKNRRNGRKKRLRDGSSFEHHSNIESSNPQSSQVPSEPLPFLNVSLSPVLPQDRSDSRLYVTLRIRDLEIPALVDTGAEVGIIFQSSLFYDLIKAGVRLTPINSSVQVANGATAEISGSCYPLVRIGNAVWKGQAFLMKKLSYPAILGIEALRDLNAFLNFKERKLVLQGHVVKEAPEEISLFSIASLQMNQVPQISQDESVDLPNEFGNVPSFAISHPGVNDKSKTTFLNLLTEWGEKFSDSPGISNVVEMKLYPDPSMPPVKLRPYPLSPQMKKIASQEIDKLLSQGLIEPSESPWAAPAFLLPKKNKTEWRLTVDYREVNKVCRKNAYPLPLMQETLDRLKDSKFVSNLDLVMGYHQIKMANESQELTAFSIAGRGHFQYKVMPFGLSTAPAVFQAAMEKILRPVLGKHTHVYLDDIIIASKSFDEHMEHLQEVFQLLLDAGLRLNWKKCNFLQEYTEFLGFIVGQGQIKVSPKKVEAVQNFPRPKTLRQLRGFLALLSFVRRFIPNLAERCAPLNEMLKKGEKIIWTPERNQAFMELKNCLTDAPVLSLPDFDNSFEIHCDASDHGLGGVLLQLIDGEYRVIAYASKVLSKTERNYSVTEKECLSVIYCVEKWRAYIEGQKTIVKTDHSSLVWLHNLKNPMGRLARWVTRLAPFDLDISYVKGKDNQVPDYLSRAYDDNTDDVTPKIAVIDLHPSCNDFSSTTDQWYLDLIQSVEHHPDKYPSFKVDLNILYKAVNDPILKKTVWKPVVPQDFRKNVLHLAHDSLLGTHFGISKTLKKISEKLYWPGMRRDVKSHVSKCIDCQTYKAPNNLPVGQMANHPIVEVKPFDIVSMDLVGPLPLSKRQNQYILVLVDTATKFVIAEPLRKATATACAKILENQLILQYGPPRVLLTDNGNQLIGNVIKNLCASYNIKLNSVPFYFPSANQTERYNRTIKTALAIYAKDDHRTWDDHLPYVVFSLRSSVSESTSFTPARLVFGRELNQVFESDPALAAGAKQPFDASDYISQLDDERKIIYEKARVAINKAKSQQSKQYNLRHRQVIYTVGTLVWRKNFELSSGVNRTTSKLNPKYIGPFKIASKYSNTQYELCDLDGKSRGRWHVSHLKPYLSEKD